MTLQEYLVKLGFSVDEPSLKKFTGAVAAVGSKTAELGTVALETATAIEVMVDRVARHYETLYYVSQRTGQSVRSIQATQYGFQQIGISAEQATDAMEGFATSLRTQPWLKGFKFVGKDIQETMGNLQKSGLPYFLQQNLAARVGISETMFLHYQKFGKIEKDAEDDLKRRQVEAGFDPKKLSDESLDFGRALNRLESEFGIFGGRAAENFIEPLTKGITALTSAAHWLNVTDNKTHGLISTLETLAGTVGALWLVEKVLKRIGLAVGIGGAGAAGAGGAEAAAAVAGAEAAAAAAGGSLALPLGAIGGAGMAAYWANKKYGFLGGGGGTGSPEGGDKVPLTTKEQAARIDQAMLFFEKQGYPKESAAGITAGLFSESGLSTSNPNPTSGAYGIAQWLGDRVPKFQQQMGKPLRGSSYEDQLKYLAWELENGDPQTRAAGAELKKGGLGGRGAAYKFIHGAERPGPAGDMSDMNTAGPLADALSKLTPQGGDTDQSKHVTLNANTTVHVSGEDTSQKVKAFTDAANDVHQSTLSTLATQAHR